MFDSKKVISSDRLRALLHTRASVFSRRADSAQALINGQRVWKAIA